MSKPFFTYKDQIDKLEKDKNLIISDKGYALEMLEQIGYFRLIGGYKHLFKNKTTQKYKDKTNFEDIVCLYMFDEKLRELSLKYILKAEQHFKSLISYNFCARYGDSQNEYLTKTNYNYTSAANKRDIDRLVKMLGDNYVNRRTDYPYIEHAKTKHRNLPLWVLINAVSFGSVSKMYLMFSQSLQISISRNYKYLNEKQLGQVITVLTKFRNACAHGERLFSYKTRDSLPDLLIHKKMNIPKKGNQYIYGKNDMFAVVISLRYLLPPKLFSEYKKSLTALLSKYINNSAVPAQELLTEMGFPPNWKNISRYKMS